MEKIYKREDYFKKIRGFYKDDMIKVISGIRRCGKSFFFKSIIQELIENGVKEKDIIYIELDKKEYKNIKTSKQLEKIIDEQIVDNDFKYLFIDEIQNVKGFETLINSYREEGNISIFITGSNSYLLSGELVTKLTGRYIEIEMMTLSFYEYIDMKRFLNKSVNENIYLEFEEYIRNGGINDIGDLFSTVTERFLPVFGTFLLYIASILFFSLFLVLPGIATIFYFFFAVYLSALGDLNDGKKFINGGKALARSFQLVKKNLIRFSSTITLLAISAFVIEKTLLFIVKTSGIPVDISISKAVLFTALDVIVICGALLINKFESIESEYLAETIK